ncbi:hypothetical protein CYLTODRAFT_424593 [Cylindrobasidium torrendii FP15055 ss-10]|uniref:Rho GTPase activation protein n=1 Tax=Cylindrobasidium torrendii FP15055 ss-10 TaxID=1314674 RepID=A0A0D7B6K8_9AGAR|nr:hypothetical protein CYLTODRAFT_424593 [Cylindrobasidium torrendii FP15055 ss-10]
MLRRSPSTIPNNVDTAGSGSGQGGVPMPVSPSSGSPITSFLTRPSKWFARSASSSTVQGEGRRKHKISMPTDPRPILDGYAGSNARSVMDLSTTRPPGSLDLGAPPASPSVPNMSPPGGLGDLRAISQKSWSRSADDLGTLSYSPASPSFQERVALYRGRSNSNVAAPPSPGPQPFPTSESPPPLLLPTLAVSPPEPSPNVHNRSQSFGPRMVARRAVPPSPKRKGSGPPTVQLPPTPRTESLQPAPEPKRASQIIHNSGYVSLGEPGKPYKVEMKGSKLFLHKPSGERARQIIALFPTGIEEDDVPVEPVPPRSPRRAKKRTYWGKTTHPDLAKDRSEGTFEALIHEAIFGPRDDNLRMAVALVLPLLVGNDKFEAELGRWDECTEVMADYRALHAPPTTPVFSTDFKEPPEDPLVVARTLTCYHRASLPIDPSTASFPDTFFGSDTAPHWLTRHIINRVLHTDSRLEAISFWIRVGELCRNDGDEATWAAIRAALCSPPIARLDKAWKRVDAAAVEQWAGGASVVEPRLTPWGGDLKTRFKQCLESARHPTQDEVYIVSALLDALSIFIQCRSLFDGCRAAAESLSEQEAQIVAHWSRLAKGPMLRSDSRFERLDQFMPRSLEIEPRRRGLYEQHYWNRATHLQPGNITMSPLLFIEPLPIVTLAERTVPVRDRLDSSATDIQTLRGIDGHILQISRPPGPNEEDALTALERKGTVIPVFDGELMLIVGQPMPESAPSSRPGSRPNSTVTDGSPLSRLPSIRVKPGSSHGLPGNSHLDRKSSMARRSSLPALSSKPTYTTSDITTQRPLRVLVQAGTIDRLVDVLVHGLDNVSVSVADDNGEISLQNGTRELVVDRAEFSGVWWNVYRSFVTPIVFFELLRKMYLKDALNRKPVIDVILEWLNQGHGGLDLLDDIQLYQSFQKFLDVGAPDSAANDTALGSSWVQLSATFKKETMRPSSGSRPPLTSSNPPPSPRPRNMSIRNLPDLDRIDVEELVSALDGMGHATFSNVTEEDLYITSDILETQSVDRTAWYLPLSAQEPGDDVEIQTIYSYLNDVAPSPLVVVGEQHAPENLYRLLPPSVRGCIRGHSILRKWLIFQITAKGLGVQQRGRRIEVLLQAVEQSRGGEPTEKKVRTFAESVITGALMSVESRFFAKTWQHVASVRGASSSESLVKLLDRKSGRIGRNLQPLTVDMGWILDRLLDVISMPDVVDSVLDGLVNLDKRRLLVNLIGSVLPTHNAEATRIGFERLNNAESEVLSVHFDHRALREEAVREAGKTRVNKPFWANVKMQNEKLYRDRGNGAKAQNQHLKELARNEKRGEVLSKAMRGGHRNKKSMSSAILHFMRPISSAFVSDSYASMSPLSEWNPNGKPAIVISLTTDAKVRPVVNAPRSWMFEIVMEDGGHYVLQAVSRAEMQKWLDVIGRVTSLAAQRRLTYIASKPDVHVDGGQSKEKGAVFGVSIEDILRREAYGGEVQPGAIPRVIFESLTEIEARGLAEVGIYRIAGATSEINALKAAFNSGKSPISSTTDIHAVCDIVKSWFRALAEPLFPPAQYRQIIEATKLDDLDTRLEEYQRIIFDLPQCHFDLLKRIIEHLDRVADYEEHNQMTADSLAIVFSPNLMRTNDFALLLSNMGHSNKLIKALITHYHAVFTVSENVDDPESPVLDDLEEEVDEESGEGSSQD